jgi:high-affinity K+ transport system ATPase subunit B
MIRINREKLGLMELKPTMAHKWVDGNVVDVPIESIKEGDKLLVYPGERIPIDGVLDSIDRRVSKETRDLEDLMGIEKKVEASENKFHQILMDIAIIIFLLKRFASVDESVITGESNPIIKTEGSLLFAGTTNIRVRIYINASYNILFIIGRIPATGNFNESNKFP